MDRKVLLVTGGAGFIGSNFVLEGVRRGHKVVNLDALTYAGNLDNLASIEGGVRRGHKVVNLDALTYAGNLDNLASIEGNPAHLFVRGSILDGALISNLLTAHQPDAVVHFAAESHGH